MIRLSLATGPVSTMLNGFHLTGICGAVGAAAGASRLLDLDAATTANALGLAATQSAGLMGFLHDGSETKRLHAGKAAQSGILAAHLARSGLTGPRRVFELEHGGFCHAFGTDPEPGRLVEGLGQRWHAGDVSFKRYSCCGSIHSTLDLVSDAVAELGVTPDEIDEIEVRHSPAVISQCGWTYEPSDTLHAQMSVQYCVAALLLEGTVLPVQFRPALLADPALLRLASRVRFTPDDDVAAKYPVKFASRVIVRAGGAEADVCTDHPKGAPENPMSAAEVEQKFFDLTENRLGKDQQREFVSGARGMEQLADVTALLVSLRAEDDQEQP
jgi:aconitate decarboxylase